MGRKPDFLRLRDDYLKANQCLRVVRPRSPPAQDSRSGWFATPFL